MKPWISKNQLTERMKVHSSLDGCMFVRASPDDDHPIVQRFLVVRVVMWRNIRTLKVNHEEFGAMGKGVLAKT
jgi:hypothetical protein